jgi:tetratricopeptide (TPR) repeat protein
VSPRNGAVSPVRLALSLGAIIAGLWTFNHFLAGVERAEIRREAEERYAEGMSLLREGRAARALDALQRANSIVRGEDRYMLGVTEALLALQRTGEAEIRLLEVLRRSPNDGQANLLMARIRAEEDDPLVADAYYHRAIYGSWRSDAERYRLQTRLELAEYLASRDARERLLPEVLLLQNQASDDPELLRTVARLFLAAGSAERSAQVYRQLVAADRLDVDAYRGLGEAQLRAGDYRSAQDAFLSALRRDPGNAEISARLRFASTLAQLDPTPRRMSTAEKYRRSVRLLQAVRSSLEACGGTFSEEAPPEKMPRRITNEMSEDLLARAERMWADRMKLCPDPPAADDPAPLILEKLAR